MSRWENPTEGKLSVIACEKLAFEAKQAKMWIYIGKDWYTPDEFVQISGTNTIPNYPNISQFDQDKTRMGNPYSLLQRMEEHIKGLEVLKNSFLIKIKNWENNNKKNQN